MGTNRRRGGRGTERHIRVRGVRRDPADIRKLAHALIELAQAQAEADAAAEANGPTQTASADKPATGDAA